MSWKRHGFFCSFLAALLSKGWPLNRINELMNWVQVSSSVHALLLQKQNFEEGQGHNMQLISQQPSHFVSPRWPIDLPVLQAIFPSKQTSNSCWWLRPHFCTTCTTDNETILKILTGRWRWMSCGTWFWGTGRSPSLNGRGRTHVAGCGES